MIFRKVVAWKPINQSYFITSLNIRKDVRTILAFERSQNGPAMHVCTKFHWNRMLFRELIARNQIVTDGQTNKPKLISPVPAEAGHKKKGGGPFLWATTMAGVFGIFALNNPWLPPRHDGCWEEPSVLSPSCGEYRWMAIYITPVVWTCIYGGDSGVYLYHLSLEEEDGACLLVQHTGGT